MNIDILKHTIVNVCKSVTFGMKKPDKKFFRHSLESLLEYRTTVLSHLGDTTEKDVSHILAYFSYHLGKPVFRNLATKIFVILLRFVWNISPDACFCFDSVDLNKYSAKKMEWIKKVRDGSTGNIVNGYVLNAVSIKGVPIMMEREELKDIEGNEITTRYDIFETQIKKILTSFGSGYWILADRLYDDVAKYNLLITLWFRFAIRMKTSRYVTIIESSVEWTGTETETGTGTGTGIGTETWTETETETGTGKNTNFIWTRIAVGELPIGKYIVIFPGLLEPCYLSIELKKWMKNPIRVLSNEKNSEVVTQYLKRWEIERIFKSGKQEFNFEKIGTQSKHKIDHLISMVQLSLWISAYMYNQLTSTSIEDGGDNGWTIILNEKNQKFETKEKAVVSATAFCKEMKKYLKRVSKTFNRNSIICFIWEYIKRVKKIQWNLKVTIIPIVSSQLRLEI